MKPVIYKYRLNDQIQAKSLRVIDNQGKQLGVMTLNEAKVKARELNLDLIEIAPNAKPPVAKIMELGKFKYEEEKKLKKQKKGIKGGELKEIRFSPFIAQGDYLTRIARIREFLGESNKVRIVIKFKGREMGSKNHGYMLMDRIFSEFKDTINIDMTPKFLGRHLTSVISPLNKTVNTKE